MRQYYNLYQDRPPTFRERFNNWYSHLPVIWRVILAPVVVFGYLFVFMFVIFLGLSLKFLVNMFMGKY